MKTTTMFGKTESLSEPVKGRSTGQMPCAFTMSHPREPALWGVIQIVAFHHRFTFEKMKGGILKLNMGEK